MNLDKEWIKKSYSWKQIKNMEMLMFQFLQLQKLQNVKMTWFFLTYLCILTAPSLPTIKNTPNYRFRGKIGVLADSTFEDLAEDYQKSMNFELIRYNNFKIMHSDLLANNLYGVFTDYQDQLNTDDKTEPHLV
ncbi:hypothetical protein HNP89_001802 [Methanococcus maripaludis]|uniref:Uncharacterized protein n=1 Tax=Methanococcus maripaludis TaxID=39152 RepID=A0A7J9P6S3_METMI|nr:hypothetical protein [Methanococcus maripaludis]